MPCHYELSPQEIEAAQRRQEVKLRKEIETKLKVDFHNERLDDKEAINRLVALNEKLKTENNALSVKVDELHEMILTCVDPDDLPSGVYDEIKGNQVNHRQADLDRLLGVAGKLTPDQIRRVVKADPEYPLEPQLGFNPDDY